MNSIRRSVVALVLGTSVLTFALAALAAEPSPAAAPPATNAPVAAAPPASSSAPDVVRLKNGGMLRGTIAEAIPGSHVSIVLITGEQRRFEMSEVEYAGPNEGMPAPSPPTPASPPASPTNREGEDDDEDDDEVQRPQPKVIVHSSKAQVKLEGNEPLTFHLRDSSSVATAGRYEVRASGYTEICSTPCTATLPAGRHTLALSKDGAPIEAKPVELPDGESTLRGEYVDNSSIRGGGYALAVVGGALMVLPLLASDPKDDDRTGLYAGVAGGGLLMVAGFGMAMVSDGAEISVVPGLAASATWPTSALRAEGRFVGVHEGLTVKARF